LNSLALNQDFDLGFVLVIKKSPNFVVH